MGVVHVGVGGGAVESPARADGPEVLRTHHAGDGFHLGNLQAGAGLGIETVVAAVPVVQPPVVRAYILVGAFHLHAGRTGQGGHALGGAHVGTIIQFVVEFQILLFQRGVGDAVAAGEPADDAGMVAEPHYLVLEIADGEGLGLGIVDAAKALVLGKAAVVLPLPLAAEAHEGHDAVAVAEVVDGVVLAPDVFKADAVEAHIGHHLHLGFQALRGVLHEDVVGPAGALDEHLLSVEDELAVTVGGDFALDAAKAEDDLAHVGNLFAL